MVNSGMAHLTLHLGLLQHHRVKEDHAGTAIVRRAQCRDASAEKLHQDAKRNNTVFFLLKWPGNFPHGSITLTVSVRCSPPRPGQTRLRIDSALH